MLPFNTPWSHQEHQQSIGKIWVNAIMRGIRWSTYATQLWFLEPPLPLTLCTHVCFSTCSFVQARCVHKTLFPIIPPFPKHTYTHTYTYYHHLTNNAFKYLSKKSYRTLNQLKNSRKGLLLHVFNTIFTKKTQGGSSNLLFLSRIFFTLSGM